MNYKQLQTEMKKTLSNNFRFPAMQYGLEAHVVLDSREAAILSEDSKVINMFPEGSNYGWKALTVNKRRKCTTVKLTSPEFTEPPSKQNGLGPKEATYRTASNLGCIAGNINRGSHGLSAKEQTKKNIDVKQLRVIVNSIEESKIAINNSLSAYKDIEKYLHSASFASKKNDLTLFPVSTIQIFDMFSQVMDKITKEKLAKLLDIIVNIPITSAGPPGLMKYRYQNTKCGCGNYYSVDRSKFMSYLSLPSYWIRSVYFIQMVYSQVHLAMIIAGMPDITNKILGEFPDELLIKALVGLDSSSLDEIKKRFIKLMLSLPPQLADGTNLILGDNLSIWLAFVMRRSLFKKYFSPSISSIGNFSYRDSAARYLVRRVDVGTSIANEVRTIKKEIG